jgi:hypothetical protein
MVAPGIDGAISARNGARRNCRKQRDEDCNGPRKAGAVVHGQLHSSGFKSMAEGKGSTRNGRKAGEINPSCQRPPTASMLRCDGFAD